MSNEKVKILTKMGSLDLSAAKIAVRELLF